MAKKKEIVPANKPLSPDELANKLDYKTPKLLFTGDALSLIVRYAVKNDISIQAATYQVSKKLSGLAKDSGVQKKIQKIFPQGITSIERGLEEHKAIEQLLYQQGVLVDADPDLSALRKEIQTKGLNKKSAEGKEKIKILEQGGLPSVVSRDARGQLVESEKFIRPYKYKVSPQYIARFKDVPLPSYLETKAVEVSRAKVEKPIETSIAEDQASPTQRMQQELVAKKEPEVPSTRPDDIIKELQANSKETSERVKSKFLDFLKKGGVKALPFAGPLFAAAAAYKSGDATASEVERLIDAAEAGLEAAIIPIDATPVASGELPEGLKNNTEALQRAMQVQQ